MEVLEKKTQHSSVRVPSFVDFSPRDSLFLRTPVNCYQIKLFTILLFNESFDLKAITS